MIRLSYCSIVVGAMLSLNLTACGGLEGLKLEQGKAMDASVKANMRTVQIAAESYATDNKGEYPTSIDNSLKSYFPGGSSDGKTAGTAPINPFTNVAEWPVEGSITNVAASRAAAPKDMKPGSIEYNAIDGGKSYAIIGAGGDGKELVSAPGGTALVLSNK